MIRYTSDVTIARPPREVLEALLDAKTYERWTEMAETRFDTPGRPRVGTRGSFRMPSGPLKGLYSMEITELEPDRRLVVLVESPKMRWTAVSTLAPEGAGTRLTYAGEISLKGLLRTMEPLMAGEVARGEAREAEAFKALLEADPSVGVATGAAVGSAAG